MPLNIKEIENFPINAIMVINSGNFLGTNIIDRRLKLALDIMILEQF
jgi:hypothetical protein